MATGNRSIPLIDLSDSLTEDLAAVAAILDAAKVLTALERSRARPIDGCLATGQGFAGGHTLRDRSLADLLSHGLNLTSAATVKVDRLLKAVDHPVDPRGIAID